MRIRQLVVVTDDLEAVVGDLSAKLGVTVCFRDPGVSRFGLHNTLFRLGDTFLEVVSPVEPGTAAGRYLERRQGAGGYMVIIQTDDLDRDRERFTALGIRTVWEADHPDIRASHLHPHDTGGAIVSFDQSHPAGAWRWAGPDWVNAPSSPQARELTGAVLQSPDPQALSRRWSDFLARPARPVRGVGYEIGLERGHVRFVPDPDGRGEGLAGIEVRSDRRAEHVICGTRFYLVPE